MLEDEKLKWQFKCGSPQALARIYEKYVDTLLTLAMGLLNDAAEAEDVVQDVFVSFAKSSNGFTLRGNLRAYLTTAVVNRVRDSDPELLRYLSDLGLIPGAKITVLDFSPFDNNLRLRVEDQDKAIVLGPSVTSQVFVGIV